MSIVYWSRLSRIAGVVCGTGTLTKHSSQALSAFWISSASSRLSTRPLSWTLPLRMSSTSTSWLMDRGMRVLICSTTSKASRSGDGGAAALFLGREGDEGAELGEALDRLTEEAFARCLELCDLRISLPFERRVTRAGAEAPGDHDQEDDRHGVDNETSTRVDLAFEGELPLAEVDSLTSRERPLERKAEGHRSADQVMVGSVGNGLGRLERVDGDAEGVRQVLVETAELDCLRRTTPVGSRAVFRSWCGPLGFVVSL